MARTMALDVGDARIGVALGDPTGLLASPLTIVRRADGQPARRVAELIREHKVATLVVGYPKNMNGTVGPQAKKSQKFAEHVQKALGYLDSEQGGGGEGEPDSRGTEAEMAVGGSGDEDAARIEVVFWDERLTSEEARALQRASGGRKRDPRAPIDDVAAAIILQEYLDHVRSRR